MAMAEFGPEVSEGQETEKKSEAIDSDFEGELDGKYDEYLNGKKQRRTNADAKRCTKLSARRIG